MIYKKPARVFMILDARPKTTDTRCKKSNKNNIGQNPKRSSINLRLFSNNTTHIMASARESERKAVQNYLNTQINCNCNKYL